MSLKDNCNKEIFLVYNEEKNDNDIPVKVEIISEFMELVEHVKSLIYSIDYKQWIQYRSCFDNGIRCTI